jgi:hypothetical protein
MASRNNQLYYPSNTGLPQPVFEELQRIAEVLERMRAQAGLPFRTTAPEKAFMGQLALQDGATWDPAASAARTPLWYDFIDEAWKPFVPPGAGSGVVVEIHGTADEIDVDNTDPAEPVLSLATDVLDALDLANSSLQPGTDADQIEYDNSSSGLTADDVQEAIDELDTAIDAIPVPGLEYLGEFSPSGDNLDVVLPSTHQDFRLIITGTSGSANSAFNMRWSTDGGSTFLSTNEYKTGGSGGANTIAIMSTTHGTGRKLFITIDMVGFNEGTFTACQISQATGVNSGGTPHINGPFYATPNGAIGIINCVRLYAGTTNGMGSGMRARLYGYAR